MKPNEMRKQTPEGAAGSGRETGKTAGRNGHGRECGEQRGMIPAVPDTKSRKHTAAYPDIQQAAAVLDTYRKGKARMDARIIEEKQWWQNRHAVTADGQSGNRPVSAWLFNSICNKHADVCDRAPVCTVLPREEDDEPDAGLLSSVLPVIAERCRFGQSYSDNAWSKIKHGMAAYGVFWNPLLENGLGDIDIRTVDVLNLYWEPGVRDIQESPNLFLVSLENTEALREAYPVLRSYDRGDADGHRLSIPETGHRVAGGWGCDGDKTAVIDWYYKRLRPDGRTVLHFAKFTGDVLLYASETDPALSGRGWYDHGQYPIVLDVLYPEEGTAGGFGLLSVGRNPQGYIDELDGRILDYANRAGRVRYWAKRSLAINEQDFLNQDKPIIEVEGDIDEEKLRQITVAPMDTLLSSVLDGKIRELKETTGNRDVSQGSVSGGVTAASAITALQEAGNKGSRDMIAGSFRAFVEVMHQVIELIRQFYDEERCFRVVGDEGKRRYIHYSNRGLRDRLTGTAADGSALYRRPVFDIDVRAERESPLDRAERNEMVLELFRTGFFDPANRSAAEKALSVMAFDGKDSLKALVERDEP